MFLVHGPWKSRTNAASWLSQLSAPMILRRREGWKLKDKPKLRGDQGISTKLRDGTCILERQQDAARSS